MAPVSEQPNAIRLTLNGQATAIDADVDTPLLYVLRNDLALKGTRFGCGQAMCGACTVLVDGQAALSCDIPLGSLEGKSVETIEALRGDDGAHPLVEELIAGQAAQCGYCIPGIVMAAKAFLSRNSSPSRAEIASALDTNLCRCGAHVRILDAVERAATRMREAAR